MFSGKPLTNKRECGDRHALIFLREKQGRKNRGKQGRGKQGRGKRGRVGKQGRENRDGKTGTSMIRIMG
jgi:hypothetical protein